MIDSSNELRSLDLAEMLVGAMALAFPVATTEEIWNLGGDLSMTRALVLLSVSVAVIGWIGIHLFHAGRLSGSWRPFLQRILVVYVLTACVSSLILLLIDKLPLFDDPALAIRRTILVTFPAVFSATFVDSLK